MADRSNHQSLWCCQRWWCVRSWWVWDSHNQWYFRSALWVQTSCHLCTHCNLLCAEPACFGWPRHLRAWLPANSLPLHFVCRILVFRCWDWAVSMRPLTNLDCTSTQIPVPSAPSSATRYFPVCCRQIPMCSRICHNSTRSPPLH